MNYGGGESNRYLEADFLPADENWSTFLNVRLSVIIFVAIVS